MKQITVLGGLGYIGSHLLSMLSKKGYIVKNLDCEMFGKEHIKEVIDLPNVTHIKGNICNAVDLIRSIEGSDCVIHLAGLVGDPACALDEEQTWLYNLQSSNLITDICNHYGVKKLIYASSCSVYGAAPSDILLNEGSYLNPVSLYARTKIDSERIFFQEFTGCCTVLRLATVFGASERMRFDLVTNLFSIQALKKGSVSVFGGTQYRPFIHCEDVARAFLTVLEHEEQEKIQNQVFNISCESVNIKDLAKIVVEKVPSSELEYVETKEDDRNYKVASDKARWLLNFTPKYNLSSGVSHMLEFIKKKQFIDWEENDLYYNARVGCGL